MQPKPIFDAVESFAIDSLNTFSDKFLSDIENINRNSFTIHIH